MTATAVLAGIITIALIELARIALRDAFNPAPLRKERNHENS